MGTMSASSVANPAQATNRAELAAGQNKIKFVSMRGGVEPFSNKVSDTASSEKIAIGTWFSALRRYLVLAIVLSAFLEGVVFNHFYFRFALGDYQTVSVPLPYNEQLGTNAYVFTPQQKSLVLQGVDLELMTVGFKLKGEHTLLSGTLALTDDASLVTPVRANHYKVAPTDVGAYGGDFARTPAAPYKFLVRSNGKAHSLVVSLENVRGVVILSDLTLNVAPEWGFNWMRFLGMVLLGAAVVLVWRKRWYTVRIGELSARSRHLVQGLSLALCLGVSLSYSYLLLPTHISPNLLFDFNEHGFAFLGNPQQSLLLDFPQTQQELEYHDAYVQNLDALLKGQWHIDVSVDTAVLNADERLFDPGWRAQNKVEGYWDRTYYEGKYYAYYGYGPILVLYLPIYVLTGQVPSPSLALFFFSTLAILGLYLGTYALARFYGVLPRANVLVWLFGSAAVVLGTHLVVVQCFTTFYAYAPLLAAGLVGLLTYLSYSIPSMVSVGKKRSVLVALGLIMVLIVHTRPLLLLPCLAICCPIFWGLIRASVWQQGSGLVVQYDKRSKLLDALCVGVPLALGAILTMAMNYLRFGGVLEFGQRYCITWENQLFNHLDFTLEQLSAMVEIFITRAWIDLQDFPYFGIMQSGPQHLGNFIPGDYGVGLLASPAWWGVALALWVFRAKQPGKEAPNEVNRYSMHSMTLLKVTLALILILVPLLCYVQFALVSYTIRYLSENMAPLAAFVVLLWARFISYDESSSLQAKICYWAVLVGFGVTIVMEGLGPFSLLEQYMPYLVPDDWIRAQDFFTPLSTVR